MIHKREHMHNSGYSDGVAWANYKTACGKALGWREVSNADEAITCTDCMAAMASKMRARASRIEDRMRKMIKISITADI